MLEDERIEYFATYPGSNLTNPNFLTLFRIYVLYKRMFAYNDENAFRNEWLNNTKIELKDFDKMPDSEALEIVRDILDKNIVSAKASGGWFCMRVDNGGMMVNVDIFENQMLLDEVRRRGYATMWRKYGVQQLIKKGWLILK